MIPTRYEPAEIEPRTYSTWLEEGAFAAPVTPLKPRYAVMIPPPNVTGILHMGHALNHTMQDVDVRYRRMRGLVTLWLPGTDHAGIATQNVVERLLKKEGKRRQDLGREAFVASVWKWKDEYERRILDQIQRMGQSCDWSRTRFTMDEGLTRAVRHAFVTLYRRGLIYKGKYLINWCPRCLTALSDEEAEKKETPGKLWHLRYPVEGSSRTITVATTRPETMLGDTAVAVHPGDERYAGLVGTRVRLPLVGRLIPVIADEGVDRQFGTGAVKVTPAHDPNDFAMGAKHGLASVTVMNPDATMNAEAGPRFAGLDRFEARKKIVEALEAEGLLERVEDHVSAVGRCYRCDTIVEPYLSDQWFVRMRPLADKALAAQGKIAFHPARWEKVYRDWLVNVRDWCISRQIWWGHRIPVFTCGKCGQLNVSEEAPAACERCGARDLAQETDVLDTWFSSGLWPFSTLGWPERTRDVEYFYPSSTLFTDRGIIYFWVARMVMMGLELMGEVPFRDVCIHGTVLDAQGRRMSKSLGNGIDPLEMVEQYSADAVRFSLMILTTEGQDVRLSKEKFEQGRNFTNKVWNASRFVMMNLEGDPGPVPAAKALWFEDRWILSSLQGAVEEVTAALEAFRYSEAATAAYRFTWNKLCDWYLELVKPRLEEGADAAGKRAARAVLVHVLESALRLLHPFAPFLTEEVGRKLRGLLGRPTDGGMVRSAWPSSDRSLREDAIEREMEGVQEVVRLVRKIRQENGLKPSAEVPLLIHCEEAATEEEVLRHADLVRELAGVSSIRSDPLVKRPPNSEIEASGSLTICVPLEGLVDAEERHARIRKKIERVAKALAAVERKLADERFLANAPEELVAAERARRDELAAEIRILRRNLEG